MNIFKYYENGIALKNNDSMLIFIKRSIDCYSIEISKDENNERVFSIPYKGLMSSEELEIHNLFEHFICAMFGNDVLHGEYKSSDIKFNAPNKRILLKSDCNNGAVLGITYEKDEIRFEIKKVKENDANYAIFCYSDCNLRGGFICMFKDLYESLNKIALEPNKNQSRERKN